MKAFVKVRPEPGGTEYQDWEKPKANSGEAVIEVKAAGICGTDIHLYDWADNIVREYKPRLPLVMGHEFSGLISEIGQNVKNLKVGDHVTVMPVLYCGDCYYCRQGQPNICDNRPLLGLGTNGAFAQFASVRAKNIYKMPKKLPFDLTALSELTCVCFHAIERVALTMGEKIAVVGCGPVGLVLVALAKKAGAGRIFVTGLDADRERLQIAQKLGAVPVVVDEEDPKEKIFDFTNGMGADVVFETAGTASGVLQAIDIARKDGRVGMLGQGHETTEIATAVLSFRELRLIGVRAYNQVNWERVSDVLLNAQEELTHIITNRLPLSEAEEGIRLMKARKGLKIMLAP